MSAPALDAGAVAPGQPRQRRRRRSRWLAYFYVGPATLLFIIFVAGPFVAAIILSLYSWDLLTPATFVGLGNFVTLFTDPLLPRVLGTTFLFALASIITHVVGGLLLALAVNRRMSKVVSYAVRTTVFFPFLISWAAVSLLWKYVLDPSFGYVQYYFGLIGVDLPNWFSDPAWALPGIIGIDFWHTIGFTFIIMLAGLQTVPTELVEAARTDGANSWQVFWSVTLPLMSPTLFFATVITFIGAFQIFEPMQIITGGGPNNATKTIVMYLYEQGFQAFQIGYASAVAILVFVILMLFTALQFWGSRRWVHES